MAVPLTWNLAGKRWNAGLKWNGLIDTPKTMNTKAVIDFTPYTAAELTPVGQTIHDVIGANAGTFPALPITPTLLPFPLPTKYHLHFGAPMRFTGNPDDEDAELERRVREVKQVIQAMLDAGKVSRKGIFF